MSVSPIPEGYHSVTPYLSVQGAAKALDFYRDAFGATEIMRMTQADGRVGHAELQIGNSRIMLADEHPEIGHLSPLTLKGAAFSLLLYVEDVDAVFAKAVAAGAKPIRPVQNQFYGDRSGMVTDPFGHTWSIATHVEDLSPEEMEKRMAAMK
ncbi:MAG: VOC family protein [Gemmataceae bacterium]